MKRIVPPFSLTLEASEEIRLHKEFRGSHDHVFTMAVTNQAVYVSTQKLGFKNNGWYLKRVPLSEVKNVSLLRQRSLYSYGAGGLMIVAGTVLSILMMWALLHPVPGVVYHVSGWPFAIAIGGFVVPFIAKGRRVLLVRFNRGKFRWKPQLAIDKKTRETCRAIQEEILTTCRKLGLSTSESR
ncbi:MAG TPA: hypothetical protein VE863_20585 [Pyrinomonadaceae bacterium]|jgi:hypothetical protein|nr:hypothetical protein [Pyrinomonadaceae bacterium]